MSLFKFLKKVANYLYREIVLYAIWHFSSYFPLFPTLMGVKFRSHTWRWMGAEVGKNCFMGFGIYLDVGGLKRLHIGNDVLIGAESLFLFHRRDLSKYYQGMLAHTIPMREGHIYIEDHVQIGMRAMILPGVRLGEGCVVGANAVVTRDVPPYTIVTGQPARPIKEVRKSLE